MKHWLNLCGYSLLGFIIIVTDIITKQWALQNCLNTLHFNNYITCKLSFNRGVAWSLFSFDDQTSFVILSCIIVIVLIFLVGHTILRWQQKKWVIAETMVIAGAGANLIDRYFYEGVVDFILVHYQNITFPAFFNIADVAITLGVIGMLVSTYYE